MNDEEDWKELYYRAMVNKRKNKTMLNWVFVTLHGVGSTRAYAICHALGVDPEGTNFIRETGNTK